MSPERKPSTSGGGAKKSTQKPTAKNGQRTGQKAGQKAGQRSGKGAGAAGTKRPGLAKRILRGFLLVLLGLFLLGAAAFAVGYVATDIPDPNEDFTAQTSFIYYSDGKTEIGRFASQNRTSISLSDVPQHVQDAVIAAEDRSFYTNKGVDPKGIVRAAFSNARGNSTQGASTITQQYVKVFYLTQDRTLTRKVKEAFVSLKLQRQQSKAEILQGYLNTIYFGRGAYGIQAAAKAFFDKDAKDLTIAEGATLAAVLNSPSTFDPEGGAEARARLLGRYQYVLNGMVASGSIAPGQGDRLAVRLPKFPTIKSKDTYGGQRGHMLSLVRKQLLAKGFSDEDISGGGLKVTTTFTRNAMAAAAQAVREERPPGLKKLHVAVASVDPKTGALKGMYAGQDYLDSQINWALAGGAPGSAFKPFALAAGILDGYSLKSTFQGNSPYVFPNGVDKVVNEGPGDGNDYGAKISLETATEQSVNTAYVDLTEAMEDGPKKVLEMAVKMGIPRNSPGLKPFSGISLGSLTVNPVNMANAYGTIANGGKAKPWYVISKVSDASGAKRFKAPKQTTRAVPNDIDRDVSYALQQVVQSGTGQNALSLGRPAAGKTGTATNDKGDVSSSWFVGYTPQLATAVMYVRGDGNDALNGYMPSYFGADYPTRTWTAAMRETLDDAPVLEFPPPANVKATQNDHAPKPTFTPEPTPTRTESEEPEPRPEPEPSDTPEPPPSSPPPSPPAPSTPPPSPPAPTSPPASPTAVAPTATNGGNGNGNGRGGSGSGGG